MKMNDRLRAYANQINLSVSGSFKNDTAKRKLISKLTPAQRQRVLKKQRTEAFS